MPSTKSASPEPGETHVACSDEDALARFARRLATVLPPSVVLTLEGDLGAGKTTFVKKLAAAVGIDPAEVTSPTFTLVQLHEVPSSGCRGAPPRLVHMDAYRLSGLDDLASLGWEEMLAAPGWLAVEWPERIAAALPEDRIHLQIEITGESSRTLHLTATAPALQAVIAEAVSGDVA